MQIAQVHELRELRKTLDALSTRVDILAAELERLATQHQADVRLLTKARNTNVRSI